MSQVCLYQKKKHSTASKEHNKISTKASNLTIKFKVSLQSLENRSYIVLYIAKASKTCLFFNYSTNSVFAAKISVSLLGERFWL